MFGVGQYENYRVLHQLNIYHSLVSISEQLYQHHRSLNGYYQYLDNIF